MRTKRRGAQPIPQHEFGFAGDSFRLVGADAIDGARAQAEIDQSQAARQAQDAAQLRIDAAEDAISPTPLVVSIAKPTGDTTPRIAWAKVKGFRFELRNRGGRFIANGASGSGFEVWEKVSATSARLIAAYGLERAEMLGDIRPWALDAHTWNLPEEVTLNAHPADLKAAFVAELAREMEAEPGEIDGAPVFVLITGNTYPVRHFLRSMGGKWNAEAQGWNVPAAKADEARKLVAECGPAPTRKTQDTARRMSRRRWSNKGNGYTRFSSGAESFRNPAGRCEDAPCCGCCS